jgi:uncharacterized repeat protein (TIGR01451 family)
MTIDRPPTALHTGAACMALGVAWIAALWIAVPAWGAGAGAAVTRSTEAASVATSAPRLSIAVDDGHAAAAPGDTLTYTVTVQNLGTADVAGLELTQSVPAGLKLVAAAGASAAKAGSIRWHLDLEANGKATFHATMKVTQTPAELLRLATVACARTSSEAPPIVCAADSDQLPAGASAVAGNAASAHPAGNGRWYLAVGVGLFVVALAVLAVRQARKA